MKRASSILLLILIHYSCDMNVEEITNSQNEKIGNTTIQFLNHQEGFEYIMNSSFVDTMSLMDYSIRLKKDFTNQPLEKAKSSYQNFLQNEVLNWDESQKSRLISFLENIIPDIEKRTPSILQDTLVLIKTSGKEEFNAFYTCEKAIIFPEFWLGSIPMKTKKQYFTRVLYHELFHIYTRNNYDKHPALYEIVGFKPQEFEIPSALEARRITNPDFFDYNYLIELENQKGGKILATILTYNKSDKFDEKQKFSDLIGFGLFPVEELNGKWQIQKYKGYYQPIPFKNFKNFYSQVGTFTDYLMGAEEILADGYSMKMIDKEYKNLKNTTSSDLKMMDRLIEIINLN